MHTHKIINMSRVVFLFPYLRSKAKCTRGRERDSIRPKVFKRVCTQLLEHTQWLLNTNRGSGMLLLSMACVVKLIT